MAARIPQYQRRVGPEVTGAPRVAQASVDASGLARGLSSLAGDLTDIHQREMREANQTAVLNADNQLGTWQNEAIFNPETGAFTKKGQAALNITNDTLAQFDQQRESIASGLANEQQRQMFTQAALQRRSSLQGQLGGYEFDQQQKFKNQVDDAAKAMAMNTAALNYSDPKVIAESHARIDGILQLQAQRNGWAPEVLEANRTKATSDMYSDILKRQASQDPYKAQAALKQYQQYLTADDLTQVGSSIDGKVERLQQKAEMAQLRAEARGDRALGKISAQITSGIPATDEMWANWANQVKGTPAAAEFNELRKQEVATQQVLRQPIDQQAAYFNKLQAELQNNGGTVAQANNLNRLGRAIETNAKMMAEAPLDYLQQRLGANIETLDLNSENLPAVLSDRVSAIQGMRKQFGPTVALKPLLPQEAKTISAQLEQMSPDQQSKLFGTLHAAMGDDKAYAGAMQQIAPDSPVRALAGMLAGKQRSLTTGTHWFRPDDVVSSGDVAKTMALGESILNKSKAQKGQDGGGKFPIPKQADFDLALGKQLGTVFAGQPQSYSLAAQAVKSYYTGAAAEAGDVSGEVNNALMKKAIKATVGDVVDFNGSSTLAPWGMPGDTFEQVAQQRLVETMKAQGMSDQELATAKALTLRQARDGVYYVMQGNQYKYGANGKPLMINVNGGGQ
ncbi:hypothetical protein CQW32_17610 [Pseudomonas putida]|uniref:hypothetical protein n=1 Tax=Pseudomonas putida TaxID=303 RepID=UPI000C29676C|nr:hypothetical protein [Pseudomonas putida]PJX09071.1 hypothetical protein CQW32_17610 [Pseudomonas putida]